MSKRFLLSAAVSTFVVLAVNGGIYPLFYGDFLKNNSELSAEVWDKVQIPVKDSGIAASIVSVLMLGILAALVVQWSQAKTFSQGLKTGLILGVLMVGAVDFGLMATTHYYSTLSGIVDILVGGASIGLAGGAAAMVQGRGERV